MDKNENKSADDGCHKVLRQQATINLSMLLLCNCKTYNISSTGIRVVSPWLTVAPSLQKKLGRKAPRPRRRQEGGKTIGLPQEVMIHVPRNRVDQNGSPGAAGYA